MEEGRSAFKILTDTPAGKKPLGKPSRRWEDNIRMYLKEIGINTRSWVDLAQNRDYWRALLNEPPGSISHGVSSGKRNKNRDHKTKMLTYLVNAFIVKLCNL